MNSNPKVTVLVPSYNHGSYIRQRLESILSQSYKNIELIVIDDCSSDDSNEVILEILKKHDFTYIRNVQNSGTPFSAWERVATMATGDFIWICESDDFADSEFLEIAVSAFKQSPRAVLFYCNSWVVDEDGKRVGHTDSYFHDIWKETRWDKDFISDGARELADYQMRGQIVPNMSSALITTAAFRRAYSPFLKKLKLTGDWLFIGWILQQGDVLFSRETLSNFRTHEVTSRVRVKSARSQAEFMITKYLLFLKTGKPLRSFADLMQTDAIRFLHEPAGFVDVTRALLIVSPLKSLALAFTLGLSVIMNPHYLLLFYRRFQMVTRS